MHPMIPRRWRLATAVAALAVLAACGGGADDDTAAPPPMQVTAEGSSGRTVSLAWAPVADARGYTLQRKSGNAGYAVVAELPAGARHFVDEGLAPQTGYVYRVAPRDSVQALAAEHAATTTDEMPLTTAPGAPLGPALHGIVGAAGGRIASADGQVVLDVAPGTFAAATEIRLQALANTAPDGREDGVRVQLAAAPAKPLTLTVGYGEALAPDAGGLAVALQRRGGSWLSLPLTGHDSAARQLTVELPPGPAPTSAVAAMVEDDGWSVTYDVVKYLGMTLSPASASIPVGATQALVPYARAQVVAQWCGPEPEGLCFPMPVLKPKQIPFTNQKAGFVRSWLVEGVQGGSGLLGSVVPNASVGAVYQAPARSPEPNPVRVTFRSVHQQSGRIVELSSRIKVVEPTWDGAVYGKLGGAADIGFEFSAQALWTLSSATQDDVFEATGTQSVHVIDITCTASASPASVELPPGMLKIDRSTSPATYTMDLGSLWHTVITGSCPGHGSTSVGMAVPGLLQVSGTLSSDGRRIEGTAVLNHVEWEWYFSLKP